MRQILRSIAIILALVAHGSGHAALLGTASSPALEQAASAAVSFSGATYVIVENQKPGTGEWRLTNRSLTSGAIEGFASLTSVPRGGTIQLFVKTAAPSYTIDIFRIGYYGGTGGRRMMATVTRTSRVQPACREDAKRAEARAPGAVYGNKPRVRLASCTRLIPRLRAA